MTDEDLIDKESGTRAKVFIANLYADQKDNLIDEAFFGYKKE